MATILDTYLVRYTTRFRNSYNLPLMRLTICQKGTRFVGPNTWNKFYELLDLNHTTLFTFHTFCYKIMILEI